MEPERFQGLLVGWTRGLERRPLLRALAGLLLAHLAPLAQFVGPGAPSPAEAAKRAKRRKRRRRQGKGSLCRKQCRNKKTKQARRRCRRRCEGSGAGGGCAKDGDCGAGQTCQNGKCRPADPDTCPMEGTEVVVTTYADVADDYEAGTARAIPAGPDAVANFVNGDFEALYAQFSPEMQALITLEELEAFASTLQHNRVHFEVPSAIGIFNGYFDSSDHTISGYFTQVFTQNFWIQLTTDPDESNPLVGIWEGLIWDPTGSVFPDPFPVVITFWEEDGHLAGELDVVDFWEDIPITDISFAEHRPLVAEPPGALGLVPLPDWTLYTRLVQWGDAELAFTFAVDAQDRSIVGLNVVPDWPPASDPAAGLTSETVIRLPLNGVWWIAAGGPKHFENHHLDDPAQRHACDFTIWNVDGGWRGDGLENQDYWEWDQPIFAPADGVVFEAVDGVPDNSPGVADPTTSGNVVILETAPQEFLVMAHLRQGSVAVSTGEQVQEGQFLGRVGNSGFSRGPHLHMHLLRGEHPLDPAAVSLPFRFKDLLVDGQREASPSLVMGDFVQHDGCPIPVPAEYAPQPERGRARRGARGGEQLPMMTRRSAESFRSPAVAPLDVPPSSPWRKR